MYHFGLIWITLDRKWSQIGPKGNHYTSDLSPREQLLVDVLGEVWHTPPVLLCGESVRVLVILVSEYESGQRLIDCKSVPFASMSNGYHDYSGKRVDS